MSMMVGVAAAAISASAWPFFVPILLSFEVFDEFESVYDAVIISICVDLTNAIFLTVIYNREGLVQVMPAMILGAGAALPAVVMAVVAQYVLGGLQNILKNASGYGLFFFALIFLFKGFKLRKQSHLSAGENMSTDANANEVEGLQDQQRAEEATNTPVTTTAEDLALSPPTGTLTDTIYRLGPGNSKISDRYMGVVVALTVICGALAGFIGFGNGLIFATMLIVFLGHQVGPGTATACACTSVLMAAVLLVFIAGGHAQWKFAKYIGVACGSSALGAIMGSKFALKLDPVSVHFFVGAILGMCAFVATAPGWFGQDAMEPTPQP